MARPIPADDPVTMATLSLSSMIFLPFPPRHVETERRRPGEEVGAMPHPRQGLEVLVEAFVPAQAHDGLPQTFGLLLVAVALQAPHQEPVNVDPDRPPPVTDREEREAVPVVARHGRD